ncbi:cupin domain-containing protein [Streptomyces sp. NBC_01264]|uniref:cupin domain-containing protein n=1 Tax=Streptomyces sp. NBC_01264 TaxID=2903804 RepID=UPI002250E316|nr:cupin domain-containing protein [Streptomyces sp. NBC_01264]MCX4781615.1 cupin domain-containing protein [Streptomyces sp. NBC_01264]
MEEIGKPLLLEPGDVVVFAGDRRYVLASDPDLTPVEALPLLKATTEPHHHTGAPGIRETVALGGHIELEAVGKDLLIGALPPVMHRRASTEAPAACWLLNQAFHGSGASFVADLLAQLLFVQVLRTYLAEAHTSPVRLPRALAEAQISPATARDLITVALAMT